MIEAPFPEFDELLTLLGEAGSRLSEIDASEGAAGNMSVYLGWSVDPRRHFPLIENVDLPLEIPALSGSTLLVTGSGRRLREVIQDPAANLGALSIDPGGRTGKLYTSPRRLFAHLTSELNSHLAVHNDQVALTSTNFHAVIHAQPPYLTFLSHIPRYRDQEYFNTHLLRWEPETIVNLPEGIGVIPFAIPSSGELMSQTLSKLCEHRIIVWSKHGVVARSDLSVKRAADRIEYAEAAARYEYMNLMCGEPADGISRAEILSICETFDVNQTIYR
jgi:rhamnulose-1-phosphate aldolase